VFFFWLLLLLLDPEQRRTQLVPDLKRKVLCWCALRLRRGC
jgi:hypothetical protein